MASSEETLEAFITFRADSGELTSTIDKSLSKINAISPVAGKAEQSIKQIWHQKSEADGLISKVQQLERELDKLRKKASQSHGSGGHGGIFKDIKSGLGRHSTIGQLGEMMRFGGAIAGAAALVEAFHGVAEAIVEVHQKGDMTFNGLALGIANNLPVLKDFSAGVSSLIAEFWHDDKTGKTLNEQKQELAAANTVLGYVRDGRTTSNDIRERGTEKALREADTATIHYQSKQRLEGDYANPLAQKVDQLETTYQEQLKQLEVHSKAEYAKRSMERDEARSAIATALPGEANKGERESRDAQIQSLYKQREGQIKTAEEKLKGAMKSEHDAMLGLINSGAEALLAIKNSTELIGMSQLKAAEALFRQQGYTGDTLVNLVAARGKEIGLQLKETMLTPMERYQKEVDNLDELRKAGDINEKVYQRAKQNAAQGVLDSTKTNSVEGFFMENLKNRFIEGGINSQMDDINKQLKAQGITDDGSHQITASWDTVNGGDTKDNTEAVKDNTDAQKKALDAMADLGKALMNAKNKAVFGD